MAWGSKTSATQLTTISTEQYFNQLVTLNPGETAHVQVSVDFAASTPDDAIISVYGTLDPSSETWDLTPFITFMLTKVPDPNRISFTVSGLYKFRVGVKRAAALTALVSADLSYRINGINL